MTSTASDEPGAPSGSDGAAIPPRGAGSVRAPAIRGSIWTIGGYAGGQFLRLASNVILARLLFPAVFGQVALIYTFTTALQLFSDVGISPAIIQNPRGDDPKFLNTVWTIACVRGVLIWLASWVIAIPAATFYGQPQLLWLIPAAAFGSVVGGFEATSPAQARRHMRIKEITIMDLASQVLGSVATIGLAFLNRALYGPNDPSAVWAVVAGGLVTSLTRFVYSYTVLPHIRHRFALERETLRSVAILGRWIFLSTLLTFLAGPTDRLVFGKMLPMSLLGVYGIAATLAVVPAQVISNLGSYVIFPAYSRLQDRSDFPKVFNQVRLPLLVGGALLVSGVIASGPFLIWVLYDARYAEAGWILQFLGVTAWFQILENTNASALLAKGRADWMAAGNGAKLVGMVLFLTLGFHVAGFPGALAGMVMAEVVKYGVSAGGVARRGLPAYRRDFLFTLLIGLVSSMAFLAGSAAAGRFHSNLAGFLLAGLLASGSWSLVALRFWRQRRFHPAVVG